MVTHFFGKKLSTYRVLAGFGQREFARALDMLPDNYNKIETGKKKSHLRDTTLELIASLPELKAVGVTLDKLKAWRAIDLEGESVIRQAFLELSENPAVMKKVKGGLEKAIDIKNQTKSSQEHIKP